jgi:hypothetical protein
MQDVLAISMKVEALEAAPEIEGWTIQNFDYGDYNRRPSGTNEIPEVITDTVTTAGASRKIWEGQWRGQKKRPSSVTDKKTSD